MVLSIITLTQFLKIKMFCFLSRIEIYFDQTYKKVYDNVYKITG